MGIEVIRNKIKKQNIGVKDYLLLMEPIINTNVERLKEYNYLTETQRRMLKDLQGKCQFTKAKYDLYNDIRGNLSKEDMESYEKKSDKKVLITLRGIGISMNIMLGILLILLIYILFFLKGRV